MIFLHQIKMIMLGTLFIRLLNTFEPYELRRIVAEVDLQGKAYQKGVHFTRAGEMDDKIRIEFQNADWTVDESTLLIEIYDREESQGVLKGGNE